MTLKNDNIYDELKKYKDNDLIFISKVSIFFEELSIDDEKILSHLSKIDKKIIKEQLDGYLDEESKVRNVRKKVLEKLMEENGKITLSFLEKIKLEEIEKYDGKSIFQQWSNFGILHTIFYYEFKSKVETSLKSVINTLEKELNSINKIKSHYVGFNGANNLGSTSSWLALYNRNASSHKGEKQLFINIQGNIISYGLHEHEGDSNLLEIDVNKEHHSDIINKIIEEFENKKNEIGINNNLNLYNNNNNALLELLKKNKKGLNKEDIIKNISGLSEIRLKAHLDREYNLKEIGNKIILLTDKKEIEKRKEEIEKRKNERKEEREKRRKEIEEREEKRKKEREEREEKRKKEREEKREEALPEIKNIKDAISWLNIKFFIFVTLGILIIILIIYFNYQLFEDGKSISITDFQNNFLGKGIFLIFAESLSLYISYFFFGLSKKYLQLIEVYNAYKLIINLEYSYNEQFKGIKYENIEFRKENIKKIMGIIDFVKLTFDLDKMKSEHPGNKLLEKMIDKIPIKK